MDVIYDVTGRPVLLPSAPSGGGGGGGNSPPVGAGGGVESSGALAAPLAGDDSAAMKAGLEALTAELTSLRAQLLQQQAVVEDFLSTVGGLQSTAVELAKDFEVLRFANQRQTDFEMQDYDDDIPGATRETVNGETRTLIEDHQIGSIEVTDGLALKIKGTAQKTVQGRVYALRDWDANDGAVNGWKTVAGARLLPAGVGGQELEIPVWSSALDRWVAVTLAGSDLLSLLGWSAPTAGHILTGNGAGVVPSFQDLGAALGVLTGADAAGRVLRLVDVEGVGLVARWVSASSLTAGAGLVGSAYDGLSARSWALDFGSGYTQVARGNHGHDYKGGLEAQLIAANAPTGFLVKMGTPGVIHSLAKVPASSICAGATGANGRLMMFDDTESGGGIVTTISALLGNYGAFKSGVSAAAGLYLRLGYVGEQWTAQWDELELALPAGSADGDILVWDATVGEWVAAEPPEQEGSVVPAGTADGQILKWSAANSEWQAVAPPQDLGADVPTGDNEGDIISWDATAGEWVAVPAPEPATLVRGAGLTGSDYDTTAQQTWAVDIGTGSTQVAAGDHAHDFKAGLETLLTASDVPNGFMVRIDGEIWGLANVPAALISAGASGASGRVLAFGPDDTDVGGLAEVSSLLANFGPVGAGVPEAAGLYLRLASGNGQWETEWARGVPDAAETGELAYWNASGGGWAIAALAGLLGSYVPAEGTKAQGQVLQLTADLSAKWAEIPSAAAVDPGEAVAQVGAWNAVDDGTAPGAEYASSANWTAGGANGLVLCIETRQRYYKAGAKTWYAYGRKLTFDKYGRLYHVSAETRWVVTVPEEF